MLNTAHLLQPTTFPAIERGELKTLQVNLGLRCNLSCQHCHVNAGPQRTEQMERGVVEDVLRFLSRQQLQSLDLTGGAPELNPNFRYLVEKARAMGVHVIDRCNLTVLEESGQEGLAEFLAANRVEVVASLPCYLQENVDSQRGKGSYDASIRGLKQLNQLGYGDPASGLSLNLVYNPLGPSLPPPQGPLEADYRKQLAERFGISFNQLFTITNMPIRRFGSLLHSKGEFHTYLDLLRSSFSPDNLQELMCRSLISVDWQGRVYDCDFNQMLDMPISDENSPRPTLSTLLDTDLRGRPIQIAEHCYGCTAGQGSSCGGALD
ncbi:arsenosugar biosynthesis radical SAM (seleno)protein ArsS [Candidatus Endoriftia persephone]|jgi:radical SAM/Cys-rich protein|uniref:Radical SAM domain protein n=3 Tax=Gammaproteobacteria TaxID=1236 RepID=G2FB34_9GAMM|nr:arsenosugar biosynthesis radical SAM (seleno)protein ArsS [Candidatus Endoriftia persephone]EGV51096.1 radical SAM domain-containing protein [endosymbiont of Riftia pachyptila (vent Ph05)]EGW55972.1 radical SAM domain protein [endosymbiont of Tevnia jerichonana (vent Tica)]USF88104.1 arsenosugar biosynthesis radical SAM protein ArsS [Candidatus Endoriftia persephone]